MKKTRTGRRAPDEDLPAASLSIRYIESSALVAAIVERDAEALSQILEIGQRVTSALTLAEANRSVIRARAGGRLTDRQQRTALRDVQRFAKDCIVVSVTDEILERTARPFPVEPVRTLDAIHLATIESMEETPQLTTVVTRDQRIARNARALGYAVVPE